MHRLALLLVLLVACATPQRPLIVVLGSSTAAGYGLSDPATSWVARYTAFMAPRARVTNLAVSGFSTFEIQPTGATNPPDQPAVDGAHNITAALALHPDVIVINLPSNDAARGVAVEKSLANIAVVARAASDAHVACWVTTSQPRQLPPEQAALLLEYRDRVLHDYRARAIDFFTPLAGPDNMPSPALNQGDGVHPNPEGHRLLFEQVRTADLLRAR